MDAQRELNAAEAAKEKARRIFGKQAHVTGVGLTRREGVICVKVNLAEAPPADADLPSQIDGIPILVHVTGRIRKQD